MLLNRKTTKDQPFKDTLKHYIAHPPEGSVKMLINPEMALEMLTFNTRNRPVTHKRVELYARQMAAGEWHYTRVPIIFSDEGRVIDGQHRLYAVIEADAVIPADVAFGAPDEAFAFIDVGKTRGTGDIFAINGVKNHNAMASMTRLLDNYYSGFNFEGNGKTKTPAELYDLYSKLDDIQESMTVVNWFGQARIAPPSLMGALHYVCAQKNRKQADEFFDAVCHGGAGKDTPEGKLHKRLIEFVVSGHKPNTNTMAGLTVVAWNRHRQGISGHGMKFDGGKLPAVR